MTTEDVRPICIFCHQRFVYAAGEYRAEGGILATRVAPACDDPRTLAFEGRHVEFFGSTKEQRDARFGPATPKPTEEGLAPVAEPTPAPQIGFGI